MDKPQEKEEKQSPFKTQGYQNNTIQEPFR